MKTGLVLFFSAVNLMFLMSFWAVNRASSEGAEALRMALHTLRKMALGGINDHVAQVTCKHCVFRTYDVKYQFFAFTERSEIVSFRAFTDTPQTPPGMSLTLKRCYMIKASLLWPISLHTRWEYVCVGYSVFSCIIFNIFSVSFLS